MPGGALAQDTVQGREVEDAVDVGLLGGAGVDAVLEQLLVRSGERVDGVDDVLERAVDHVGRQGGSGGFLEGGVEDRGLLGGGGRVEPVHGFDVALQQCLDRVRVLCGELLVDDQDGGDELALLPQVFFVDEDLGAGLEHQPGGPRFRQPRAVELAVLEQFQGLGVLGGVDGDVAAAVRGGPVALLAQPRAEGHVLGAAQLRRRELLAFEVRRPC